MSHRTDFRTDFCSFGSSGALGGGGGGGAGGEAEGEGGALAETAFGAEAAVVGFDDVSADGEAEAGAAEARGIGAGLGGEEGFEDAPEVGGGDADAVVGDADFGEAAGGVLGDADLDDAASGGGHGLSGVDDEVHQDLLDLGGVDAGVGAALGAEVELDAVVGEVFVDEHEDFFDEADNVGGLEVVGPAGAGEAEDAAGDGGGALGGFEDLFEGFAAVFGVGVAEAELGVVEDGGEGVVELVADAAGEDAETADALEGDELAAEGFDFFKRGNGRGRRSEGRGRFGACGGGGQRLILWCGGHRSLKTGAILSSVLRSLRIGLAMRRDEPVRRVLAGVVYAGGTGNLGQARGEVLGMLGDLGSPV